jgi:Zn-dependent protease/CBS domain-containing protein
VHWTVAVILVIIAEILGASVLPAALPHQPAVVYWAAAAATALVFAGSLLAHELAHSLVAQRNGVRVRSITLWMLGGVAELAGEPPNAVADLRIALAGPAASLAQAAVFGGVALAVSYSGGSAVAVAAAVWLAVMNGALAVFNMLPGAPLDGGRVPRAVLWRIYQDRMRAAVAAARAGRYLGFAIIAVGLAELLVWGSLGGLWLMLIGWFLTSAARAGETATVANSALAGLRVADVMILDPDIGHGWSTVQDFIDQVAAHSRQGAFPVVGFGGELAGVVVSGLLGRIRLADRPVLRLDQVALTVPSGYLATLGDPAGPLLTRPPMASEVVAVVLAQGRVVGLVTAGDLSQAVRRSRLRAGPGGWPVGGPTARDSAGK